MMNSTESYIGRLLRENATFFIAFALYLLVAGIILLNQETGDDILFFSARRTYISNLFFIYGTELAEAAGFIPVFLALLCLRFRYALIFPVLGLTVSFASRYTKLFFAHPRPYAYLRDLDLLDGLIVVDGIHINTGLTSFPSGHTMAAFAIYGFLALCLPPGRNKLWGGIVCFTLALIVAVSRIYLVQHFLKDVYLGAIIGLLIALVYHALANRLSADRWSWLDRSLLQLRAPATLEDVEEKEEAGVND